MKKIIVYSTSYCPYCLQAKMMLKSAGVRFEDIDLSSQPELREKVSDKYNWQTVPMIIIGEKFIGGFQDLKKLVNNGEFEKMLS